MLASVIAFIILVAIALAIAGVLARKRTAAVTAAAADLGFTFVGNAWTDAVDRPDLLGPLFQTGTGRDFRNILTGNVDGRRVELFDYSYVLGGGTTSTSNAQTVAAYTRDDAAFPPFTLYPSGIFTKLGDSIAPHGVAFDAHPGFAKAYQVRCADEAAAHALFTPELIAFIERHNATAKWRVEGSGRTLVFYRNRQRTKPAQWRTVLEETSALAGAFFTR